VRTSVRRQIYGNCYGNDYDDDGDDDDDDHELLLYPDNAGVMTGFGALEGLGPSGEIATKGEQQATCAEQQTIDYMALSSNSILR